MSNSLGGSLMRVLVISSSDGADAGMQGRQPSPVDSSSSEEDGPHAAAERMPGLPAHPPGLMSPGCSSMRPAPSAEEALTISPTFGSGPELFIPSPGQALP